MMTRRCLTAKISTYVHVIFCDLEQVKEAPRFGELTVLVEDKGIGFGQVVGVIFPVNLDCLESEKCERLAKGV